MVPLDIASNPGATKADVTLYEPKTGVTHTALDQTGSSASVTGDARQGGALAVIVYKDAMDATVATAAAFATAPTAAVVINGNPTIQGTVKLQ